jgi:hypothetical protein
MLRSQEAARSTVRLDHYVSTLHFPHILSVLFVTLRNYQKNILHFYGTYTGNMDKYARFYGGYI